MNFQEKINAYNNSIDRIAEKILEQMKIGGSDWIMPWHKGLPQAMNTFTGKFYSGNNLLILWLQCLKHNYPYNQWATLKQWRKIRARVRKGEKGTLICVAVPKDKSIRKNYQVNLFGPHSGKNVNQDDIKFRFKFSFVFNTAQVSDYYGNQQGLFDDPVDPDLLVKKLITNSEAEIAVGGDRALYNIITDVIKIPELARFKNETGYTSLEKFNSTLLHELIHWTGHETRCKREIFNSVGSPAYAFEELVAELGSAILSTMLNRRVYPRLDHAHYLNSWLNVLEQDFSYFMEALELARYSIFWLFKKTEVYPTVIKDQFEQRINKKRLQGWIDLSN